MKVNLNQRIPELGPPTVGTEIFLQAVVNQNAAIIGLLSEISDKLSPPPVVDVVEIREPAVETPAPQEVEIKEPETKPTTKKRGK